MRVLFIEDRSRPQYDPVENNILYLAQAVQRSGHSAQILAHVSDCSVSGGYQVHELPHALQVITEGVPVVLLPWMEGEQESPLVSEQQICQLCDWIQRQGFSVAHLFHPITNNLAVHALQRCHIPLILSLVDFPSMSGEGTKEMLGGHSFGAGESRATDCCCSPPINESQEMASRQTRELLSFAQCRVCTSQYAAARYQGAFSDFEFAIVPQGLTLGHFLRPQTHLNAEKVGLTLGCVSAGPSPQGLSALLQAFASVSDPHLRLQVLDEDKYIAGEVQQFVSADPRVQLYTDLSARGIAEFFHSFDLLCLPWDNATARMRILDQAAAAGVPMLASGHGDHGAWISEHGCGQVLPVGSIDVWANVLAAMRQNSEQLEEWRKNLPLPLRIEEETFFYESLYRRCLE